MAAVPPTISRPLDDNEEDLPDSVQTIMEAQRKQFDKEHRIAKAYAAFDEAFQAFKDVEADTDEGKAKAMQLKEKAEKALGNWWEATVGACGKTEHDVAAVVAQAIIATYLRPGTLKLDGSVQANLQEAVDWGVERDKQRDAIGGLVVTFSDMSVRTVPELELSPTKPLRVAINSWKRLVGEEMHVRPIHPICSKVFDRIIPLGFCLHSWWQQLTSAAGGKEPRLTPLLCVPASIGMGKTLLLSVLTASESSDPAVVLALKEAIDSLAPRVPDDSAATSEVICAPLIAFSKRIQQSRSVLVSFNGNTDTDPSAQDFQPVVECAARLLHAHFCPTVRFPLFRAAILKSLLAAGDESVHIALTAILNDIDANYGLDEQQQPMLLRVGVDEIYKTATHLDGAESNPARVLRALACARDRYPHRILLVLSSVVFSALVCEDQSVATWSGRHVSIVPLIPLVPDAVLHSLLESNHAELRSRGWMKQDRNELVEVASQVWSDCCGYPRLLEELIQIITQDICKGDGHFTSRRELIRSLADKFTISKVFLASCRNRPVLAATFVSLLVNHRFITDMPRRFRAIVLDSLLLPFAEYFGTVMLSKRRYIPPVFMTTFCPPTLSTSLDRVISCVRQFYSYDASAQDSLSGKPFECQCAYLLRILHLLPALLAECRVLCRSEEEKKVAETSTATVKTTWCEILQMGTDDGYEPPEVTGGFPFQLTGWYPVLRLRHDQEPALEAALAGERRVEDIIRYLEPFPTAMDGNVAKRSSGCIIIPERTNYEGVDLIKVDARTGDGLLTLSVVQCRFSGRASGNNINAAEIAKSVTTSLVWHPWMRAAVAEKRLSFVIMTCRPATVGTSASAVMEECNKMTSAPKWLGKQKPAGDARTRVAALLANKEFAAALQESIVLCPRDVFETLSPLLRARPQYLFD